MPGPYRRKKYHFGDTHLKKGWSTKRRTKDLDEVQLFSNFSEISCKTKDLRIKFALCKTYFFLKINVNMFKLCV